MSNYLELLDIKLFRFINGTLSNPLFDKLMPFLTDLNKQPIILALCAAILLWMIIRGKLNTRLAAIILILTIIISDQFNSHVIKFWFERVRPCHTLHNINLLVGCGSGYSFPSSHAVNNFAGALVLSFFFPNQKWWFLSFATAVAFSRVYVGVHYPSDVIGGGIIGLMIGGMIIVLFILIENFWHKIKQRKSIINQKL